MKNYVALYLLILMSCGLSGVPPVRISEPQTNPSQAAAQHCTCGHPLTSPQQTIVQQLSGTIVRALSTLCNPLYNSVSASKPKQATAQSSTAACKQFGYVSGHLPPH